MYSECIELIKKDKRYREIFDRIKERYVKTGKLTGIIHMEGISKESEVFLSPLKKTGKKNFISIKVEDFFTYFKAEKYRDLEDEKIMELLYGEKFFYQRDVIRKEESDREKFFESLPFSEWRENNILIKNTYAESPQKLREYVFNIKKAMDYMELKESENIYAPLPVISAEITRDSHYFDLDTTPGKLFLDYLWFLSKKERSKKGEDITDLLLSFSIVRDEFFSFTLAYNLVGRESWSFSWQEHQPLNISLYNLRDVKKIDSLEKKAFIFENPAVFRGLKEKLDEVGLKITLLCTTGQLNVSSLIILDKLVESDTHLYYAGDFDPEGLQIAQNLKIRYGENLSFFHMEVEDYYLCKGEKEITGRLNRLDSLTDFTEIVTAMKQEKTAGYQELLIDKYFEDIKKLYF